MKIVYTDTHKDHDPQLFMVRGKLKRSNEQPERANSSTEIGIDDGTRGRVTSRQHQERGRRLAANPMP